MALEEGLVRATWRSGVAREAHNLKVPGSKPGVARYFAFVSSAVTPTTHTQGHELSRHDPVPRRYSTARAMAEATGKAFGATDEWRLRRSQPQLLEYALRVRELSNDWTLDQQLGTITNGTIENSECASPGAL